MPQALRDAISVAGRAGQRVRQPAGTHNCDRAADASFPGLHRGDCTVFRADPGRRSVQHAHASILYRAFQRVGHVVRAVGHREHTVAALRFQRHAERFKQRHRLARRQSVERAVQKAPVARNMIQKFLDLAIVRYVTASLARNAQLFAQNPVGLQQRHGKAAPCGGKRAHHSSGAATDHNNISFQWSYKPRIPSKSTPAPGTSGTCAPCCARRRPRSAR